MSNSIPPTRMLTTFIHPVVIVDYHEITGQARMYFDWECSMRYELILDEHYNEKCPEDLDPNVFNDLETACDLALANFIVDNEDFHSNDSKIIDWARKLVKNNKPFADLALGNDDDAERFWS